MIRMLWLPHDLRHALVEHALEKRPHEACGILIGSIEHGLAQVKRVIPVPNIAENTETTFRIDDRVLVSVISKLAQSDDMLIGFYHSHPKGAAIPSPTDIRLATYPDALSVIVGLQNPMSPAVAAWSIGAGVIERIEISHDAIRPPPPTPSPTRSQHFTILLGTLIAFAVVIATALYLLPPAPLPVP